MLDRDATTRYTVQQCRRHPFLSRGRRRASDEELNRPNHVRVTNVIRKHRDKEVSFASTLVSVPSSARIRAEGKKPEEVTIKDPVEGGDLESSISLEPSPNVNAEAFQHLSVDDQRALLQMVSGDMVISKSLWDRYRAGEITVEEAKAIEDEKKKMQSYLDGQEAEEGDATYDEDVCPLMYDLTDDEVKSGLTEFFSCCPVAKALLIDKLKTIRTKHTSFKIPHNENVAQMITNTYTPFIGTPGMIREFSAGFSNSYESTPVMPPKLSHFGAP